mmetsp:Transcript_11591/g.17541  ORF Transcript_11591/g.17541 Transcript_11591/m.17541 type:complete len:215 (-) Transcript_11591:37-681(-)
MKVPLYDLVPKTQSNWIAPSATIIGEVAVARYASIWYNAVVRGDINRVEIGSFSSIGENSVLLTAPSLPTGLAATLQIGKNVIVGSNCTLYSCTIGNDVVIGDKVVILEGAKIEDGAQIAAGSVVPPGRLIPAKQLWGGNPVSWIKDLDVAETWANYTASYIHQTLGKQHLNEFSPWNAAYLDLPAYQEDFEIKEDEADQRVIGVERGSVHLYA